MLSSLISSDVKVFGAAPGVQNSSTLAGDNSSSEEEDNDYSSFMSTLVIADAGFSLFLTFK